MFKTFPSKKLKKKRVCYVLKLSKLQASPFKTLFNTFESYENIKRKHYIKKKIINIPFYLLGNST